MKKMLTFGLLGVVILLCVACDFNLGRTTVTVSGDATRLEKKLTGTTTYAINFDDLQFTNSTVTINIVPVPTLGEAKVDVTYSEALDHYGFNVDVQSGTITIRLNSDYRYDIDKFDMTIYAVFDDVAMSGSGYKVVIDASGITPDLKVSASGAVYCDVASLEASNFRINTSGSVDASLWGEVDKATIQTSGSSDISAKNLACGSATINTQGSSDVQLSLASNLRASSTFALDTSGSSDITLFGTVDTAVIKTSGSSNIDAQALTCDSADIDTSGSSKISISVNTTLTYDTSGSSTIWYYGSPSHISGDKSGSSSIIKKE